MVGVGEKGVGRKHRGSGGGRFICPAQAGMQEGTGTHCPCLLCCCWKGPHIWHKKGYTHRHKEAVCCYGMCLHNRGER